MAEGKAGFHDNEHTWQSGLINGKLEPETPAAQPPKCPECTSHKVWKDGIRYVEEGQVQRYLCRSCGYRFSESKVKVDVSTQSLKSLDSEPDFLDTNIAKGNLSIKEGFNPLSFQRREDVAPHISSEGTIAEKEINTFRDYNRKCRVCASEAKAAKNLVEVETRIEKRAAGATKLDKATIKGKIVELAWWMKKQGYRESTIFVTSQRLKHLAKLGADPFDSESIKEVIAQQQWQEPTKATYVNAYARFAEMHNLQFIKPRYKIDHQKIPFIPTETELDQLIASCSRKISIFLQLLKETGMRSGEAFQLKWKDFDFVAKNVRVNNPEKHGNCRIIKITDKLIAMLKALPQKSNKVFVGSVHSMRSNFGIQRKRTTQKLKNPRLLRISFHTFRHWKATMEYHKTKDILYVKNLLGHKSINSTLLYTQLINFEGDEYDVKVAETQKEITELLKVGFEWVGQDSNGLTYFRKRK